ncbi:MAG TPA: hypothetical protein VF997_14085 [Polyangia bacterium]
MRGAAARLLVCAVAVAGCRATAEAPADLSAGDLATGGGDDLAGADLAMADMACPVGPEVCGNGCDDDRNGYTDADDPACTSQMLVTLSMGSPALWRLILEPQPHVVVLDGNPVTNGAMATYNAAFAPAAFLAYEGGTRILERRPIPGSATTISTSFGLRDVCVFNSELIVVEQRSATLGGSRLHRFMPDGKTEIMPPVSVADLATACSTDGTKLYVAAHTPTSASQIDVFDKGANGPVASGVTIAMPDSLLNAGYDRIVDLVYLRKSGTFVGLFAMSGGLPDSSLNGDVMTPFAFDGGVGAFIDGGVWHGVGEFMP